MDLAPLRRPRRILIALALFLVLTASLGATAIEDDAGPDLAFTVPAPAAGDRGRLEAREIRYEAPGLPLDELTFDPGNQDLDLDFTWHADEVIADHDGQMARAHVLDINLTRPGSGFFAGTVLLDPGIGTWMATRTHASESGVNVAEGLLGPIETPYNQDATWLYFRDPGDGMGGEFPCGLYSPLQGQTLRVGDRVDVPMPADEPLPTGGHCTGFLYPDTIWAWNEVVAIEETPAGRMMRVEHWRHERHVPPPEWDQEVWEEDELAGRSWYLEGVPYPVRNEMFFGNEHDGVPTLLTRLVAFEPGDQPLDARPDAVGAPIALDTAPLTPWVVDDTGFDHPFPLSVAWQVALDDPDSGFGAFMDDHPDARAYRIDHRERLGDTLQDGASHQWSIRVVEGASRFSVRITQEPGPHPLLGPTHQVEDLPNEDQVVAPTTWPARLPTVATVAHLWAHIAGPETAAEGPNFWELDVRRGHDGAAEVGIDLGLRRDDGDSVRGAYIEWEFDQPWPFRLNDWQVTYDEPPAVSHPPRSEPPLAMQGATGWRIDPDVATFAGLASLFVALGYYIWPALKSGFGVGLFSRVRTERLLEHPVRRDLHAAIQANPGTHYQELLRTVGRGRGTVDHHLKKLTQAGLVQVEKAQGFTCYHVRGAAAEAQGAAAIKSPVARRILELLCAEPGLRTGQVGTRLGVSAPTVSYHLKRMRDAGLVAPMGDGHGPTGQAPRLLA